MKFDGGTGQPLCQAVPFIQSRRFPHTFALISHPMRIKVPGNVKAVVICQDEQAGGIDVPARYLREQKTLQEKGFFVCLYNDAALFGGLQRVAMVGVFFGIRLKSLVRKVEAYVTCIRPGRHKLGKVFEERAQACKVAGRLKREVRYLEVEVPPLIGDRVQRSVGPVAVTAIVNWVRKVFSPMSVCTGALC